MLAQRARLRQGQLIVSRLLSILLHVYPYMCLHVFAYFVCSCISMPKNWLTNEHHPSEWDLHGLLRLPAGTSPRAKANGAAAEAEAKAAVAGESRARAKGLGEGGAAVPKGALLPPEPPARGYKKMGALRLGCRLLRP